MKALLKVVVLATITPACALSQQSGAPFCAVTLSVASPDGRPVLSGQTQLMDEQGTTVEVSAIANGRAAFCDFGFGPHSIRVQQDASIPVTLFGIHLTYGQEQHLRVVMNPVPDTGSEGGGGNACRGYVRLITPDGRPIPNASAVYHGTSFHSDAFGRLLLLVPLRQFATFRFEKPGFVTRDVSLSCSTWDDQIERKIVLTRQTERL